MVDSVDEAAITNSLSVMVMVYLVRHLTMATPFNQHTELSLDLFFNSS